MRETELRIGNYFWYRIKGNCLRIEAKDLLEFEKKEQKILDVIYQPIPLTEQWLKDFGFEKLDITGHVILGATYWRKGNIVIYEINNKYYIPIGEKIGCYPGRCCIEFDKVHELQNIFALTGKEFIKNNE